MSAALPAIRRYRSCPDTSQRRTGTRGHRRKWGLSLSLWDETGADLTPTQRCLAQCSQFATENGTLIGVPLLLCFMVLFALRLYRLFG